MKGTGDQLDNQTRAKGVTASFSINGIGGNGDEPLDPVEENEELKARYLQSCHNSIKLKLNFSIF